jgi:DNA mismatch repair protein MutS
VAKKKPSETPMMKQYLRIKAEHQDAILLFRMGDFYEMFFDDAVTASRVLGLTLTARAKDGGEKIPLAGVPHQAVDGYVKKLILAGHRVAICDQLEDPKLAKGIVDRGVTRVITAGTVTDDLLPDQRASNYLAAVAPRKKLCGLAWVDLSTGRFVVEEVPPDRLPDELSRVAPAECLFPEALRAKTPRFVRGIEQTGPGCTPTARPDWIFEPRNARKALYDHFGVASLDGFGCGDLTTGVSAAGAVLEYLNETQRTSLAHIDRLERFVDEQHLIIDRATQRSLELVATMRGGERSGSLLAILDQTVTTMGARMMHEWLIGPLRSVEGILCRQKAVATFVERPDRRNTLRSALDRVYDIERLAAKISTGRANARDLVALRASAKVLPGLRDRLDGCEADALRRLRDRLDPLDNVVALIDRAITDEPPVGVREGGMIREGYHDELDELRSMRRNAQDWMARYQADESRRTGIERLKVGFNQVFGYYIEITHANAGKVPANYTRKQTLKNAERYITPELKEYEEKILHAGERADQLEYDLFVEVRDAVADETLRILAVARAVAELDALAALAHLAAEHRYCRPTVNDARKLLIQDGRHPVLEQTLEDEQFVPNDTLLDGDEQAIAIITGPNMAGKSTYIRQVALIALMAHMGGYVPAKSAEIGLCDRIFARVGASDEISRAQSTFMVEMNETANILNNATDRSLIVLDEVGRGTSTYDGVSIAWAVTEHLHEKVGARTLFATHYHELTALESLLPKARNYNVAVREWEDEVIFLRKIIEGGTDKSYGVHVAKLAGVPKSVVERAKTILGQLEASNLDNDDKPKITPMEVKSKRPREMQMALFRSPHEATIDAIKKLSTDAMSPLEALMKLQALKDEILRREKGE